MVWSHSAIQTDNIDIELIESSGKRLRCRSESCLAVHLDRHLCKYWQVGKLPYSQDSLLDDGELGKRFENEKVDAAFEQRFDLFAIHFLCFVERGRAKWFDPQTQRPDRSCDKYFFARGLASDPDSGDIDVAKPVFEAVRLQLVPGRSERVGFDDVRTRLYIFFVDLADEIGSDQV